MGIFGFGIKKVASEKYGKLLAQINIHERGVTIPTADPDGKSGPSVEDIAVFYKLPKYMQLVTVVGMEIVSHDIDVLSKMSESDLDKWTKIAQQKKEAGEDMPYSKALCEVVEAKVRDDMADIHYQ